MWQGEGGGGRFKIAGLVAYLILYIKHFFIMDQNIHIVDNLNQIDDLYFQLFKNPKI